MKKSLLAVAVALASALVSSQARAQNYIPMELVVGKADYIIIGEVTAIGKPVEMELDNPDFQAPQKGWYHTFKVKVTRQILPVPPTAKVERDAGQPSGEKASKDEIVEAITTCADPNAKPTNLIRTPGEAPVPTLKEDKAPPGPRVLAPDAAGDPTDKLKGEKAQPAAIGTYHNATVGNSYLMILSKLPGRGKYYLPTHSMNFRPDTDASVKEVEKLAAAGIESWSWGKTVNGLQIGLYVFAHYNVGGGNNSFMEGSVVLRNTTDKPLAVDLYDVDRCLEIAATSSDGKVFHSSFYNWKKHPVTQFDAALNTIVIEPRGKIFIGSDGRANTIKWAMPLNPGKYDFQASYTSKREGKGKDNLKLWTGTTNSKPWTCTIHGKPGA